MHRNYNRAVSLKYLLTVSFYQCQINILDIAIDIVPDEPKSCDYQGRGYNLYWHFYQKSYALSCGQKALDDL